MSLVLKRRKLIKIGSQCANILSKSRTSIGTVCLSLVNIPITLDIFNDM